MSAKSWALRGRGTQSGLLRVNGLLTLRFIIIINIAILLPVCGFPLNHRQKTNRKTNHKSQTCSGRSRITIYHHLIHVQLL